MSTKEQLELAVKEAEKALVAAKDDLRGWEASPENNTFSSVEEAARVLEIRLEHQAYADCEGSHNCGADVYEQEFFVDGAMYMGKLSVEYNRHDKQYYYVEEAEFTYERVD